MNKIYDKLVLLVALLALGAGCAVYFMQSSASVEAADPGIADNPYQPIDASMPDQEEANWPAAQAQDDGPKWLFDLFTPPEIYIDAEGNFVVVPPYVIQEEEVEPFGVYLAEIRRDPYRLQLEGYIEDDLTDASKSLLLLYDEEQQQSVRARVGTEKPAHEFEVIDFAIARVKDVDSVVTVTATATLLDQRTGNEVVLTHGERLFEDEMVIVMGVTDSEETIELSEAGEEFSVGENSYILREINLEDSSVTVEKLGDEEKEPVIEVLYSRSQPASSPSPTTPQPEPTSSQPNSEDSVEALDFF